MASLGDANINLTTCSICFETFKTPKHFPCLHSFCEGCINTYITTSFTHTKSGVDCPVCRMFVAKPDAISFQEWAAKLPTNHILVSLIDANEAKSEKKLCAGCFRQNETESAVSWCVNCNEALCKICDRCHLKGKLTCNHKIVELGDNWSMDEHLQHADVLCTTHVGEKVKAYCTDHKAVCCMTCVMLQHRKCDDVISIENAAAEKKQTLEVKEFEEKLENLKQSLELLVTGRNVNLQKFDAGIITIKKDVNSLFKELTDHLSRLKADMISQISKVERDIRPEIEDQRNEITCRISALENDIELYQTIMKHSPPAQFLQTMEELSEQGTILEKYLKDQTEKLDDIDVVFKANENLKEISANTRDFGNVEVRRKRNVEIQKAVDMLTDVPFPTKAIDMRTVVPNLTDNVTIIGCGGELALLGNDHIVMSNYENGTVELRDSQCQRALSSLSLPGIPYGIKMTSETEGAVAVKEHGLIIFRITNNQIKKIMEIKINLNYDFVFFKSKYYTGCDEEIIVFDSYLRKDHHIPVHNNVAYLAVRNDTSLCYTEWWGSKLYCITMDGALVFSYSHEMLQKTTAVTVDHAGYIYVCGRDSHNIHQLSHDGKLQRIIFEHLPSYPYCISFNTRGDKAVVGCYGNVLLYALK